MNEDNCIICRGQMLIGEAKRLPCKHCYHTSCLQQWIIGHTKCPLCQYDLLDLIGDIHHIKLHRIIPNLNDLRMQMENNINNEEEEEEQNNEENNQIIYKVKQDESITPEFNDNIKRIKLIKAHIDGWDRNRPTLVTTLYDGLKNDNEKKHIRTPLPLVLFENNNDQVMEFVISKNMNATIFVIGPGIVTITGVVEISDENENKILNIEKLSDDELIERLWSCHLKEIDLKNRFIQLIDSKE